MTPLPTTFTKHGCVYTLVKRIDNFAVYSKRRENSATPIFEVVKIYPGKNVEIYPVPEDWGRLGFSLSKEDKALELLEQAVKNPSQPLLSLIEVEPTVKKTRGRKPFQIDLTFPDNLFTIQEVAESNQVEISFVHNRIKALRKAGRAELAETKKVTKGRGKPTGFYRLIGHGKEN